MPAVSSARATLVGVLLSAALAVALAQRQPDLRPNMAVKLQYERLKPGEGSRGTLINLRPGFRSGTPVHVTSAVLDVVF